MILNQMRIPPEKIDEITAANDIVDVIESYIPVKKRGKTYIALCPFHPDKNPSLNISQDKQVYHCFSCKAGGNVFSFVQNFEKIGFIDAAEKLAERAGISLTISGKGYDTTNEHSVLLEINKAAASYFRDMLWEVRGAERELVHDYLRKRNINKETAEEFGIGYSLNRWDALLNHFREQGSFDEKMLEKAGLVISNEDEGSHYDRFRGRLMFPICNESGKVVGFGGRKLRDDDQGGKYINSPETRIYSKSRILYGLNFAKDQIRFADSVILVEGYMDLISMHRHGIKNVVASSGTALTDEQVRLLARYTKKVYLLFDSDSAGVSAAKRGTEMLLEGGFDITVVTLPKGEDPDSFLASNGRDEFDKQLNSGKSLISFIAEIYGEEGKLSSIEGKTDFIREVIEMVSKIPDAIKRSFFIKELSEKYSISENILRDELENLLRRVKPVKKFPESSLVIPERSSSRKSATDSETVSVHERELLRVFLRGDEEAVSYLENNLETTFIHSEKVLKIVEHLLDDLMNHGKTDVARIIHVLGEADRHIQIVMDAVSDKYEASSYKYSTFDSLLERDEEPVYCLKNAQEVIKELEKDYKRRQIEILKENPDNLSKVFELQKQLNEKKKRNV